MSSEEIVGLLKEMRDAQKEALLMQRESLDLQKGAIAQQRVAVEQQTRHLRLYRRVLAVSAVVAALAAGFLLRLL